MFNFKVNVFPIFYYILRAFLLCFSLFLLLQLASILIKKNLKKNYKGFIAVILVFSIIFYFVEIFFTFFSQTNGLNDTYTSVTWKYKYWRLNPQGYRDIDFRELSNSNNPSIIFIGDSYTEGHGIANPDDRYTNIVRKHFPNLTIYNAGKCGWGIFEETNLILNMPIKPKYIFLQVYYNDLDYLINQQKSSIIKINNFLLASSQSLSFSKYSIFFNYLNSNFNSIKERLFAYRVDDKQLKEMKVKFRINEPLKEFPRNGLDVLNFIYTKNKLPKDTLDIYFNEILEPINKYYKFMRNNQEFSDYINKLKYLNNICAQRNSKLILVPFPNCDKVSIYIFENYVYNYFINKLQNAGFSCINLLPDLQKSNLNKFSVNKYDAHANEASNAIIAQTIINYMNNNLNIYQ
ncbi:MAG: SGNH/GDSL hydrolase family protein [Chitinophagales bacterium]